MFGYVRPLRPELKVSELETYRAAYCGLCRALGKRYGFAARFFVNYDMTFLYLLLGGAEARFRVRACRCPARCGGRKQCVELDAPLEYAADATVLLMWWKLADAQADGGFLRACAARAARCLFRRAYRRARERQPELDACFGREMAALAALESQRCDSIDRTADCFAQMTAACASYLPEGETRRDAAQLLYHVGRFIYLTDALDDLPDDAKSGAYNPLCFRYRPEGGVLPPKDAAALGATIESSLALAAQAMESLPLHRGAGVVRNILYLGLPAVLRAVQSGAFHDRKHKRIHDHTGEHYERSL